MDTSFDWISKALFPRLHEETPVEEAPAEEPIVENTLGALARMQSPDPNLEGTISAMKTAAPLKYSYFNLEKIIRDFGKKS